MQVEKIFGSLVQIRRKIVTYTMQKMSTWRIATFTIYINETVFNYSLDVKSWTNYKHIKKSTFNDLFDTLPLKEGKIQELYVNIYKAYFQ